MKLFNKFRHWISAETLLKNAIITLRPGEGNPPQVHFSTERKPHQLELVLKPGAIVKLSALTSTALTIILRPGAEALLTPADVLTEPLVAATRVDYFPL